MKKTKLKLVFGIALALTVFTSWIPRTAERTIKTEVVELPATGVPFPLFIAKPWESPVDRVLFLFDSHNKTNLYFVYNFGIYLLISFAGAQAYQLIKRSR